MLLSKKRDFVREMEEYGNVQRYGQQDDEILEQESEREMNSG